MSTGSDAALGISQPPDSPSKNPAPLGEEIDPEEVKRILSLGFAQRALAFGLAFVLALNISYFGVIISIPSLAQSPGAFSAYVLFRFVSTVALIILSVRLLMYDRTSFFVATGFVLLLILGIFIPLLNLAILSSQVTNARKLLRTMGFSNGLFLVARHDLELYRSSPWPMPQEADPFRPE